MSRPNWHAYFFEIAKVVATRSDCERSQVGAVVVKSNRICGTGYNGAPSGEPGCSVCPRRLAEGVVPGSTRYDTGPGRCVAVHAEANALLYCNREDLVGATVYITREPCGDCLKLIRAAGVDYVYYETAEHDVLVSFRLPGDPQYTRFIKQVSKTGYTIHVNNVADVVEAQKRHIDRMIDLHGR